MFLHSQYKLTLMRSGAKRNVQFKRDVYVRKEECKLQKMNKIVDYDDKAKEKAKKIVSKIKFD
jgi:hypothetical protein